jgi:hypothetical protein
MYLVFEVPSSSEPLFYGAFDQAAQASMLVLKKFKEISLPGDELVGLHTDKGGLLTLRKKEIIEPDPFEYVDNDGNDINADGSLKSPDDALAEPEERYVYDFDYLWAIVPVNMGEEMNFTLDQPLLTSGSDSTNVFESSPESVTLILVSD